MIKLFNLMLTVLAIAAPAMCQDFLLVWGYECHQNKCVKVPINSDHKGQSQSLCRMLCDNEIGTLWPKPRGTVRKTNHTVQIDRSKIRFETPSNLKIETLWRTVKIRFQGQIENKIPEPGLVSNSGGSLMIKITVEQVPANSGEMPKLTYDTDESYSLKIIQSNEQQVTVDIIGKTFFGARHGLETLSQLIVYDDVEECVRIIVDTEINDAPAFKHRGILLDTSRNYFSVKSIKRTINGMAMSKMNVFHWHIIDSNSFPFVVNSHPDLYNFGAYSSRKIYTHADIADVVEYARARGVRVIPEFDGPAHAGEGWQNTNMIACFKAQPWKNFCRQPPCGQLDPTIDAMYNVLEDIYREMIETFDPDVFHMGAGGVSFECWNSSASIRNWMQSKGWNVDDEGFVKLWGHFQTNALAKLDRASKNKKLPIIVWASQLTEEPFIDEYLDKTRYIVQTYESEPDWRTEQILSRGIRVISSNEDLFINGDTASWDEGWSEIGGWQKLYNHKPEQVFGGANNLILGSEAQVWTEQIDEFSLDTYLWPKASALGERLWSNPDHDWHQAESRLLMHRVLLTETGIGAESLQPEWCFLNHNECPKDAYDKEG